MKTLRVCLIMAATLCIIYIIYTANTGGSFGLFSMGLRLPYGDKLGHFSLFGTFALIVIIGTNFHISSFRKVKFYTALPLLSTVIVLEEFSQLFIANRNFDFVDLTADALGLFLAVKIAQRLQPKFLKTESSST